jgi:hypothetical protein
MPPRRSIIEGQHADAGLRGELKALVAVKKGS